MGESIKTFLEKDENSSNGPSAKVQVTQNGLTVRKRYLNDSLPNLNKKYRTASKTKVSRATFYRLKPFWIENKRLSSRDTCLCKTHANFDFLIQKLHLLKVVPCNRYDFISLILCPTPSQACFYRSCKSCPNLDAQLNEENHQRTSYQ